MPSIKAQTEGLGNNSDKRLLFEQSMSRPAPNFCLISDAVQGKPETAQNVKYDLLNPQYILQPELLISLQGRFQGCITKAMRPRTRMVNSRTHVGGGKEKLVQWAWRETKRKTPNGGFNL